jgi:hypothetical protein
MGRIITNWRVQVARECDTHNRFQQNPFSQKVCRLRIICDNWQGKHCLRGRYFRNVTGITGGASKQVNNRNS